MKVPKGEPDPMLDKIMREMGNKRCEACSVPNWKVYHTPGNPCPKEAPRSAAHDSESETK